MPTKAKQNVENKEKKTSKASNKSTKVTAKKEASKNTAEKKVAKKKPSTTANKTQKKSTLKKITSKKNTKTKKVSTIKKKTVNNSVEYYDLPEKYNKTMVKVLFQTPKKLFVYWEIAEADREKLANENGKDFFQNSTPFLVVKNLTKNYSFEIEINDYANSWYFNVPDSKCDYEVELIRKMWSNNTPVFIKSSNELEVPNNHILFEQNRKEIFFINVKNNYVTSKSIANLQFIKHIGIAMPITLNEFYNKFYDEKDLYNQNNPSSNM